ncbi:SHQ1 protein-domain-containing protein [Dipodascopsis tothii]|uniref:SHQ1 protein-domain-containing protein n=1 Tax=Dipodascopsis tothii TaxID=44089 RepID=UPI0034CFE9E5
MITPRFWVRQDDDYVHIDIKVTHVKAQNMELQVDNDVFIFAMAPYYLRLHFPGNLVDDDDRASAQFDLGTSLLKVKYPKETPGETFADLDLTAKLLARVGEDVSAAPAPKKPLIQELASTETPGAAGEDVAAGGDSLANDQFVEELDDAAKFDWQLPQQMPEDDELGLEAKYGFNGQYSGYFRAQGEAGNDINDIGDVEHSSSESRAAERLQIEDAKFDGEYYLADLLENEDVGEFVRYTPALAAAGRRAAESGGEIELSAAERDQMTALPRRRHLVDAAGEKTLYLGLVPLLFGYCYDARTTMDDPTSESGWTVGKLAPNVACLDTAFGTVRDVVVACTRRALAYPLYRHWGLVEKVWEDVYYVLRGGRRLVLRALLAANRLLSFHDVYYVYSKILLEDYCVWIQGASDSVVRSLAHEVRQCPPTKAAVGWGLEALEASATPAE